MAKKRTAPRAPDPVPAPVYLDCNATTPLEPAVLTAVVEHLQTEYGNAGSRTHQYGARASKAVQRAREQVAALVAATPDEVVFTSGATEANNLALLGLAAHGEASGCRHIVSTQIEHKAVLEPLEELTRRGFEVTLVPPTPGGYVEPEAVASAIRDDTLCVSVMHVNNETGVVQPLDDIVAAIGGRDVFIHTDAAQGFGKQLEPLRNPRLDLISVSGHKLYAPKGVGALVTRRRGYARPPVRALTYGGGQEWGIRPGTLPVALIVGLGVAADLARRDQEARASACRAYRARVLDGLAPLAPQVNGDPERTLPHVVSLSIPGVDSEAVMVATKDLVAISNGSACTSQDYQPSHVLTAMGLPDDRIAGALRISWCHLTEPVEWSEVVERLRALR